MWGIAHAHCSKTALHVVALDLQPQLVPGLRSEHKPSTDILNMRKLQVETPPLFRSACRTIAQVPWSRTLPQRAAEAFCEQQTPCGIAHYMRHHPFCQIKAEDPCRMPTSRLFAKHVLVTVHHMIVAWLSSPAKMLAVRISVGFWAIAYIIICNQES